MSRQRFAVYSGIVEVPGAGPRAYASFIRHPGDRFLGWIGAPEGVSMTPVSPGWLKLPRRPGLLAHAAVAAAKAGLYGLSWEGVSSCSSPATESLSAPGGPATMAASPPSPESPTLPTSTPGTTPASADPAGSPRR